MPVIEIVTDVDAPPERLFDLARSTGLHAESMRAYGEHAEGRDRLLGPGDEVRFSARHFGIRWSLTSRITALDRPASFRDTMIAGPFARFDHDHIFQFREGGTRMIDRFDYTSPLGPIGRVVDRLLLERHMIRILSGRCLALKEAAESDEWRRYLPQ